MHSKLQFHGHHSYFRKDFQMLLTLKEGHNIALTACTISHIATTKQKIIISKIRKQVGFLQKRNPIRGVQYFPIPIAMNIK